jgi:PIN domain nuclease of toxin-antitoxin system
LPGVREAALNGAVALRSVSLPPIHRDPADRWLIAPAVELGAAIIPRDVRLIDYAATGVVEVQVC